MISLVMLSNMNSIHGRVIFAGVVTVIEAMSCTDNPDLTYERTTALQPQIYKGGCFDVSIAFSQLKWMKWGGLEKYFVFYAAPSGVFGRPIWEI